jgi:hypothetical protein
MTTVDPRIPAPLQNLWSTIHSEVVWLHGRWIIYRQLYGTSPDRIAVLNRAAGTFFNVLQTMMLHDVQLSLSKLGDPAGSGARKNLTLAAFVQQLRSNSESSLADKLDPLLDKFDAACTKLRHRRNKWIAHFDLSTMLSSKVQPLEGPSRSEIEDALAALRAFMNCVELHYLDSQTMYDHFILDQDGDYLLTTLMQGLRYKQLVKERVIPHDDLRKNFKPDA